MANMILMPLYLPYLMTQWLAEWPGLGMLAVGLACLCMNMDNEHMPLCWDLRCART